MTTSYTFSDVWPVDLSGQKGIALIDVQSSQLDFTMLKGIGTSPIGTPSKKLGHMAVGTHTQGSSIEAKHPFVALGGVFIENAGASPATSATTSGSGQIAVMSNWGELFTTGAPKKASQVSTSANLIKNGSAIVYGINVSVSSGSPGDVVRIRNSTTDMFTFVTASAYDSWQITFPEGGVLFDTTLAHAQTITDTDNSGAASVTVIFR